MTHGSIRRLLSLPDSTRLFMCHDYKSPGRDDYAWETTVGAERAANVHVKDGVTEAEFVAMRTQRDATGDRVEPGGRGAVAAVAEALPPYRVKTLRTSA